MSVLMVAARGGHKSIVQSLLAKNVNLNLTKKVCSTSMHACIVQIMEVHYLAHV